MQDLPYIYQSKDVGKKYIKTKHSRNSFEQYIS